MSNHLSRVQSLVVSESKLLGKVHADRQLNAACLVARLCTATHCRVYNDSRSCTALSAEQLETQAKAVTQLHRRNAVLAKDVVSKDEALQTALQGVKARSAHGSFMSIFT